MTSSHYRHDISDPVWNLLEPYLPGRGGTWGGGIKDNQLFINAIFWILRTGAPWRDLPLNYGGWSNIHPRKVKELLYESRFIDAEEAKGSGAC